MGTEPGGDTGLEAEAWAYLHLCSLERSAQCNSLPWMCSPPALPEACAHLRLQGKGHVAGVLTLTHGSCHVWLVRSGGVLAFKGSMSQGNIISPRMGENICKSHL